MARQSKENVSIRVGSEFDGKGFKQAETAAQKLGRSIRNLAGAAGLAFSAQALISFGKTAIREFNQSQKAAIQLSNTVKNLGLSFADTEIQKFISGLSLASGVIDDELFPAMQKLLQTTGSIRMSESLLKQAIDFSKGSNTDLATVVTDLTNAYVGNNRGLKKYALGLSAAELKTASFDKVLGAFQKNFSGALQANLQTTAGKFDLLTNAAQMATETIGGGLVDAFVAMSGGGDVTEATRQINLFAEAVAAMERGAGTAIGVIPQIFQKIKDAGKSLFFGFAGKQFNVAIPTGPKDKAAIAEKERLAALKKSEADAEKRRKDLYNQTLKNQKALTAEQKRQAQLKKDSSIFDQKHIEIIAALKGQLSDDDRRRAELQLALLDGNVTEADKLTKQILMATDATGNLYKYFLQTPDAKNPFGYLDEWIKDFQSKLNALQFPVASAYVPAGLAPELAAIGVKAGYGDYSGSITGQSDNTLLNGSYGMQSYALPSDSAVSYSTQTGLSYNANDVNLTITGEGPLTNAIADALQNRSLSTGNVATINRRTGGFE